MKYLTFIACMALLALLSCAANVFMIVNAWPTSDLVIVNWISLVICTGCLFFICWLGYKGYKMKL